MKTPPRFALIGAAGFVAPRHLQAIKDVGGELVVAHDMRDAVGILDKFDFDTEFFTSTVSFEKYLKDHEVDWLSICSPNNTHVTLIQVGLNAGMNVICEKPMALYSGSLDAIAAAEKKTGKRAYTVLQLRHHAALVNIYNQVKRNRVSHRHKVDLTYVTPRGRWYSKSWKADTTQSGGLITNIGIHMLDALLWIFGPCDHASTTLRTSTMAKGVLRLKHADVNWLLSTDTGGTAVRELTIDDYKVDFTTGFDNLHTKVYEETLAGRGHGIEDARPAIDLAARLR